MQSSRPRLNHRSISDLTPLVDIPPTQVTNSKGSKLVVSGLCGTRTRVAKAASSGAQLADGVRLPFTPLLPLPPAHTEQEIQAVLSETLPTPSSSLHNVEQSHHHPSTWKPMERDVPHLDRESNTLASRRQARRGASEGLVLPHVDCNGLSHSPIYGNGSRGRRQLRVDTETASQDHRQHTSISTTVSTPRSAGMVRSYSLPVATHKELEEQRRIMSLGVSPVAAASYQTNSSWWAYGWPSPGGLTPSLDKNRSSTTTPHERVMVSPSPLGSKPCRTKILTGSPSPKLKTGGQLFPRCSPKTATRSPLSMISINLPDQDLAPSLSSSSSSSSSSTPSSSSSPLFPSLLSFSSSSSSSQLSPCFQRSKPLASDCDFFLPIQEEDYFTLPKSSCSDPTSPTSSSSSNKSTPRASNFYSLPCPPPSLGLDFSHPSSSSNSSTSPFQQTHVLLSDIHPDHFSPSFV